MATSTRPQWVYWGGLTSLTHVVYGASWLRELRARRTGGITVALAKTHSFLGSGLLTLDDVAGQLAGIDALRVVPAPPSPQIPRRYQATYLSVGAPGLRDWTRLHRANPLSRIPVVVTDEGLSSYGTWRTRRDAWLREGGTEPHTTVRALAVAGARQALTSTSWLLHRRSAAGWTVHEPIADEFRRRAERGAPGTLAVFCSQPWVELGLVTASQYTAFVLNVARQAERAGLSFAVRPHPVEDASRYAPEVRVVAGDSPAEFDPLCVDAAVVLGASSTALINLAAVHGVPTVRVSHPAVAELDRGLSRDQESLIDTYLGAPVEPTALAGALGRLA
ncbi:MAG TPA: hypothetical protein PKE40_01980 [Arachnia sp.]|nr:hypothetical protein [Arachnia sp.]HMT85098.1 hypothetical protein [Arachnia sp.]